MKICSKSNCTVGSAYMCGTIGYLIWKGRALLLLEKALLRKLEQIFVDSFSGSANKITVQG